jgi:phosphoribosylaminoimidazole synthetase
MDSRKVGSFIMGKRKEAGLTQQQLADKLCVSFQAVSKWENGSAYPNIEILPELAMALNVSADEILEGRETQETGLSYRSAGVDIAYTDTIKREMAKHLETKDRRVLNGLGPFAALYDIHFPELKNPVLVLKSEEPGSKQKLAVEYGYTESICHDMINHLVNDIAVMGARPLAVLDTIVCGNAEKDTISTLVKGVAEACSENECSLVGGETSIQPQVVEKGVYVLTSSIVGIAEKNGIVDGSAIGQGDSILAVAANGLHTNGYSLVRLLMEKSPQVKLDKVDGMTFVEQIMKPHTPYYKALKGLLNEKNADGSLRMVHGMAHITGGGIAGNLCRVIPEGLSARIELGKIKPLPIFKYIKRKGKVSDGEMLATFNCGVGFVLVVPAGCRDMVVKHVKGFYDCYEIGEITAGAEKVEFCGKLEWV